MYTKILLVIIIFILGGFFYLHTQNPVEATFVVTKDYTFTLPITYLIFAAFSAGAALAVVNALFVDARRAIRDIRLRRSQRVAAQAEQDYHRGIEALAGGDAAVARGFLEKAVKARPGDAGAIINLSETYLREKRPDEALRVLEEGAAKNEKSVGIYIAMAKCAELAGSERAEGALKEILKLDPGNAFALGRLRDRRIREGAWERAADIQRKIVEKAPDAATKEKAAALLKGFLFEAAATYFVEGREDEAEALLKTILKSDERFLPAYVLRGDVEQTRTGLSAAIKLWERALERFPYSEPLLLRLEDAYINESAPDRIIEIYKRGIMSHTDNLNLRLLLARVYLRLEMIDNAIEELEGIEQMGEECRYARILLGEACMRRKQGEKAAALFASALGLDRDLLPPFVCSGCGGASGTWTPRCPECSRWNSLAMKATPGLSKAGSCPA